MVFLPSEKKKKSLAEMFAVCAKVGEKVGEAAVLQAGSERLAGAGSGGKDWEFSGNLWSDPPIL